MYKTVDTQSNLQVELKYKKPCLVPFVKYMGSKYREEIMDKTMLSKQSALKLSAQEKKDWNKKLGKSKWYCNILYKQTDEVIASHTARLGDHSDVCIFIRKALNVIGASFGELYNLSK